MPKRIQTHRPRFAPTEVERKQANDRRRGSPRSRGYTVSWEKYSRERLKEYPWCAEHLLTDLLVPGSLTDHVVPVKGPDDPLFWDPTNHQTLCWSCHSAKTAREDGGFGNAKRARTNPIRRKV